MRRHVRLALGTLALVYLVWHGMTATPYDLDILAAALAFGLFAAGVDLAWGYAGILLLGSALFFGIGGYGAAFALDRGWEPLLVYPAAMAAAALLAVAIGFVGFRRGASQVHFGLIGLAIALVFERIATTSTDLTGGSNGMTGLSRPIVGGALDLADSTTLYLIVVVVALLVVLALWALQASAWGDAVRAVRMDERKAAALGYDVLRIKLQVIGLSAAVVAFAGTLFTTVNGVAYPQLFGIALNMQALVWVALGGAGTLLGPFVAAVALKVGENHLGDVALNYYQLVLGAIFVVVVVALPGGIAGAGEAVRRGLRRLGARRAAGAPALRDGEPLREGGNG